MLIIFDKYNGHISIVVNKLLDKSIKTRLDKTGVNKPWGIEVILLYCKYKDWRLDIEENELLLRVAIKLLFNLRVDNFAKQAILFVNTVIWLFDKSSDVKMLEYEH